ncbi:tetratricopeptide repeat protein [Aurantibacillus circumpalustris]|uniref:tetratricopeptide repeat protein n=1 Tax=Aurantibacillus circumpalustris TaxID=3036359 RepID=UPI00295B3DED|nr:tetratricopeptide repeat protein [Aurantibacillus circumpalustris]
MKNVIFITLSILFFASPAFSNPFLEKAEKAYDSKRYKEAIESYEKLIQEGYTSYQLYFNLGNSYYRNNELGKAIYYYELARKIEPNDEDVRLNLGIAAGKTIDKIDAKENFFISAVKTNLLSSFSTTTWAKLTIIALFLAAVLFFFFISSTQLLVKRISLVLSSVLFIGFFITYFLGSSAVNAKYENKFAIILAKEIKIMNEPTALAKVKFSLHEGTKIRVVENNGDWLLIKLDNGNEGWVKINDVGII